MRLGAPWWNGAWGLCRDLGGRDLFESPGQSDSFFAFGHEWALHVVFRSYHPNRRVMSLGLKTLWIALLSNLGRLEE